MPEDQFDILKTKDSVKDFHRSRIMFCIIEGQIKVGPKRTTKSHLEWFEEENWVTRENIEKFFNQNIRGFYFPPNNSLYCYKGLEFGFGNNTYAVIKESLKELKEKLKLNDGTKIFLGPKDTVLFGRKYAQVFLGTLGELL